MSVHQPDKKELRTMLHQRRTAISDAAREAATRAVASRFLLEVPRAKGQVVAGYWPFRAEVDVRPLLQALIGEEYTVALPFIEGKAVPLTFRSWRPETPMVEGMHGILAPDPAHSDIVLPDIVITPLLGFDEKGNRLGYGAGDYDRTFTALSGKKRFLAVGVAFEPQKLEEIPVEPYDYQLDMVVTEKRLYVFERP